MSLRCVILDLDQTIASTAPNIYSSWNAALEAAGREPMPDSEIVARFGPTEMAALRTEVGEDLYPVASDAYLRHYTANHSIVQLYDGIRDVLDLLSTRGIHRGLFTGKGRITTEITLALLGVRGDFDLVVTGDEIEKHKPDPEGVLAHVKHAGVKPQETIMIGDASFDIEAARGAGTRSGAALWDCEWPDRLRAAGPDVLFEEVDALREWLLREMDGAQAASS